jgi:hypothetical protein
VWVALLGATLLLLGPGTVWAVGQRARTSGASGTSIVRTTNG